MQFYIKEIEFETISDGKAGKKYLNLNIEVPRKFM